MELALEVREEGGRTVVSAAGELDVYTAPDLEERLAALVAEDKVSLVVDLTDVAFMDSTGLGLLIKTLKWTREKDGRLDVVVGNDKVMKVFRITKLDGAIPLHEDLAAAIAAGD